MRIYCLTCREYILETSDQFKIGGPYHGAMFKGATDDKWSATTFRFHEDVKDGNLNCPRCMGFFIVDGKILTEHGVIRPGQKTLDESFSIIHKEGPVKGWLKCVDDSKEMPIDPPETLLTEGVWATGERMAYGFKVDIDAEQGHVDEAADTETEDAQKDLKCANCGKTYRNNERGRFWYDKHIEGCEG